MFGGLNNTGKHILFFSGSVDPWRSIGIQHIENPSKYDQKAWQLECSYCGHLSDWNPPKDDDPENLKKGRVEAYKQLDKWFNAKDQSNLKVSKNILNI